MDALAPAADDVDIVVELMGGTETAADRSVRARSRPASASSRANKELLARQGPELEDGGPRGWRRAAVRGRRRGRRAGARAARLGPRRATASTALRGIVNGTTNHILSTMAADARDYADVLREAQARGYAEADPAGDVEGLDAAYKLTLLARLAFGDVAGRRRAPPLRPRRSGGDARPGITGVAASATSAPRRGWACDQARGACGARR